MLNIIVNFIIFYVIIGFFVFGVVLAKDGKSIPKMIKEKRVLEVIEKCFLLIVWWLPIYVELIWED